MTPPAGETEPELSAEAQVAAKSDCYSAGERGWMEYGQRLRAFWLAPLLRSMIRARITPDLVTLVAGVLGVAFLPLWLLHVRGLALVALWLHVLLDGLDGPLARAQGSASSRGSFTDTLADQLVVTTATIGWMIAAPSTAHIASGSSYIFLYGMVVAMAMVRNALYVPYSWLIRPRFFVYACLTVDTMFSIDSTLWSLCICNALLALKSISGFLALRRQLPDH